VLDCGDEASREVEDSDSIPDLLNGNVDNNACSSSGGHICCLCAKEKQREKRGEKNKSWTELTDDQLCARIDFNRAEGSNLFCPIL